LSITQSSGRVTELWYDRVGDLIRKDINGTTVSKIVKDTKKETETNELGQVTTRLYDDFDNLIKTTYADGNSTSATFDAKYSNVLTKTNENGVVTKYEYNPTGNLIRKTEAVGFPEQRVTEYTPNAFGEVEQVKRVGDAVTAEALIIIVYDGKGNPDSIADAEGNVTTYLKYALFGNALEWTDGRGKLWKAEFDTNGNITKITNPLGFSKRAEYDGSSNLIKHFNEYNKLTERKFNDSNRFFELTDPYLNRKQAIFDNKGFVTKVLDEENKVAIILTNELGFVRKEIDGNNNEITYSYGGAAWGALLEQQSQITYPTYSTKYYYDNRARVSQTVNNYDTLIQSTIVKYDAVGNVIEQVSLKGGVTKYQYDKLNRVKRITNSQLNDVVINYDNRNNILSVLNEKNIVLRTYSYDRNNRVTSIVWPTGAIFNYKYNANGKLEGITDSKNQFSLFVFDDAGREIRNEVYQTPAQVVLVKAIDYSYNNTNILTGYNDGATSANYIYDDLQRRLTETINYPSFSKTQSYTYYKNSKQKSYKSPDDIEYLYSYDANNQFIGINVPGEGAITINQQQWTDPLKVTLPGGSTQNFSYDGLMRSKVIASQDTALNSIQSFSYTYYDNDSIKTRATEDGIYSYLYDELDQLIEVSNPGTGQENFSYDFAGNRLTSNTTSGDWQYNSSNQLLNDTTSSYVYNANGSLETKTTGLNIQRFFYNIEDRLSEVKNAASETIATYYYDPFGRRLWKEVSGQRTYFFPSEEGLTSEFDSSGTFTQSYIYEPDTLWGTRPLLTRTNAGTFYYHLDHAGTPQVLTNKAGAIVWKGSYTAFGKATISKELVTNNLRFPGQYYDAETGLHHNFFRDYSPSIGRYLQSDPIGLYGGLNSYAYVEGNPLNWIDPYGLKKFPKKTPGGKTITMINDNPKNPSPDLDVKDSLVDTVVDALDAAPGVDSININSTKGGKHAAASNHPKGRACDINKINGKTANSSNKGSKDLQDALSKQADTRENFGPTRNEKTVITYDPSTNTKGSSTKQKPKKKKGHKTHIHVSVQ